MKTYMDTARKDAVEAVATCIVAGVTKAMTTHGDDPETTPIIILGFAAAILEIEAQINHNFRLALIRILLQPEKAFPNE